MKISEERLRLILDKVANKLYLKQWSYIRSETDETIENYFGVLVPVTLVGTDNDGEIRKPLFIKFAPIDLPKLQSTVEHIYEAEEHIYSYLMPIYKRISNVNIDIFIPECYYTILEPSNKVIVLKDMRSDGFKSYDKEEHLDKEHIRLSLEAVAKFHALSIIFKTKGGDFDNIKMRTFSDKHIEPYFTATKMSLQTHSSLFSDTIYENYLKGLASNLASLLISSTTEVRYLVYGHGDLWKENILFKYEISKPVQVCLIDFQITRKMSPAQDILHLFLTSVGGIDNNQHNEYLNIYIDTLQCILKENGLDNPYSIDDLKHDMKIVAPYALAVAAMSFSLWLGLEPEYFGENKSDGEKYVKNTILYKNTVINKLEELNSFGYIEL